MCDLPHPISVPQKHVHRRAIHTAPRTTLRNKNRGKKKEKKEEKTKQNKTKKQPILMLPLVSD